MTTVLNSVGASEITDPTDVSKKLGIDLTSATSDTSTTLQFSQTGNRTYTVIDTGTNSQFIMSDANQTINGVKSFTTPIAATSGGTGFGSYTVGDILYANTTTTLAKLADVGTGNAIISGGIGMPPSWGKVDLSTTTTGILPSANGGTGLDTSTATNGQLLIGNGMGLTLNTLTGTANQVAVTNGSGTITVSTPSTFIAPGTIQDTTGMLYSTSESITASGTNQATATALTKSYNVVTTVASGTGIVLQTPTAAGYRVVIVNRGANPLNIYPAVGGQIDTNGMNNAISIPVNAQITLQAASTTQWYLVDQLLLGSSNIAVSYGNGVTLSLTGTVPISNGGTGLSTTPSNGQLLIGNGSGYTLATLTQGTGITITNGAGTITVANSGVTSWSAGTTGLTPSSATTGAVTLGGTLIVGNGGTGQTSFVAGSILLGNGTSALASLADVAVGSVLTSGGVGVNPTWTAFTPNAVASTIASRDGNANTAFNNLTENLTSTVTAAGTTTLTAASSYYQIFTGTTTQTVSLPAATIGQGYFIVNNSTGSVTVNASGGGTVALLTAGQSAIVSGLTAAGTTPAAWYAFITGSGGGVTSFQTSLSGLTPSTATTGAVTLSGTLGIGSGGTGLTTTPSNGQLLIGNGSGYTLATLTQGTGITITNGAGTITVANSGVTSWSAGTTGLTPSSATTGAVTLAGTLIVGNGGTGQTSFVAGSILLGNGTSALASLADVAVGSVLTSGGVGANPTWTSFTSNAVASTIASRDANANTAFNNLTENLTSTVTAAGTTTLTAASSYYQIFTGTTTQTVSLPAATVGQGYFIANNSTGSVTVNASGGGNVVTLTAGQSAIVFGLTAAGTSPAAWDTFVTGANGGVTSFQTSLSGLTPSTATTGAVTLAGTLGIASGGTGLTTTPSNGQLLVGNGTGYSLTTLTQGTGITITNGAGTITIANSGVTSWSAGTTGLTPSSATTGAVTLAGTLIVSNGGTGQTSFGAGSILLGNGTSALASLADVAVGSVLTSGGVGANPTWTAFTSSAVASTIASRDANANTAFNNLTENLTSTVTAADTTTLTAASSYYQIFTGTTTQTVSLPAATVGQGYYIINNSTGAITVNASGGGNVVTLTSGQSAIVTGLTASGTTPASWYATVDGANGGVTSFQTSLSGLTPSTATTGAVTLAGTLGIGSGGTGLTTTPTNGQLLIGNGAGYTLSTLTQGTNIVVTNGAGSITVATTTTPTFTSLTVSGLTANSFLYSGTGGLLTTTAAPTNGQLLIGSTGGAPVAATLTQGTGITITNGAGTITIANAGVTSWSAGTTGLTPSSATTGAVTLAGTLIVGNGGTGQTSFGAGSILLGNGTSALASLADVAIGSVLTSGGVGANPTWTAFTPNAVASTIASRDTNANTAFNNLTKNLTSTATAAGTTTLTAASSYFQVFTGVTTQTVSLPAATVGQGYFIINNSTGTITVNASGGGNVVTLTAGQSAIVSGLTAAGTTPAAWYALITGSGGGVTSFQTSLSGLTPSTATTGAVTLAGTLGIASGGTGLTTTPSNGQLLIGNGSGYSLTTLTQGTGITITNGAGTITIANAGVTSWSAGTTGLTPSSATTGAVTLGGTLIVGNGGTGQTSFVAGSILLGNGTSALASLADVAIGSVLTSGGVGVNPTWTAFTPNATASTVASRDGNANTAFNNLTENLTSTATAASTTTLTSASSYYQVFTGTTTQTVTLPAATVGQGYYIINNSTGAITVNASGGGTVVTLTTGQSAIVSGLTAAGTTPAAWYAMIAGANGGVTSFSAGTTGLTPSTATTGAVTLAGTLVAANGGTGQSSYTVGDLLYASGTTALSKLADVATGNALISGGVGVAPSWGKIGLTTHVTGILPTANGGTGLDTSTATNGQLLIGNGSGLTLANLTQGTGITITNGAGSITISNSGVTSWSAGTTGLTPSSATTGAVTLAGTLVAVNGGTGFSSYTIGDLLYANTSTTLAKLSDVAAGSYLRSGGVGVAPVWSTLTLPNAATTGDLLYASATNTISNLADVATGNALISGGVGVAPSWGKIGLTTHVTGVLPIANGGTNSSTALNNNRIMVSSGGSIVEAAALTNGQLLIGSTGAAPVAAALTQGTGVTITNGAGSITIANSGVTSITGTANQVSASASTGSVTLSTPSTFIAPGTIQDTTGMKYSTTSAISAAGATQATATVLTTSYNVVTTVAAGTGVALPEATAGLQIEIVNRGANTLNVYPANGSGASIDGAAANAAVTLPVNGVVTYAALSATQWYTINPPIVAGSNVTVTYGNGQTTVASTGGSGTPGGVNTNVQYNNSGTFGGSNAFNFVSGANPVVNILGTGATTQLTVGGTTATNNAAVYIEVNTSGAAIEGLRTYFNRNSAGINGWITYDYDGSTPNIRITDEDNDPPYIQFNTIGSGTYLAPQYSNIFGSRGPAAGVTTGFSWKVSGTEVATMDSQWFLPPAGTTAQRPTPTAGMFRYNSTLTRPEIYVPNVWMPLTGVIDKSTTAQTVTGSGTTNLINYTLPGGTLTTTGVLRIRTGGIWNNASGATRTVVMTISFGGTTMWQDTSASLASGATIAWNADLIISSNNSANAQALTGVIMLGSTGAATTGTGDLGTGSILGNTPLSGTASVSSGSNRAVVLSINISGGSTTWTKYFHTIELL